MNDKEKIMENINELINDIEHYKNCKSFSNVIIKISEKILEENNVYVNILQNCVKKLNNNNIDNIDKINSQLYAFIEKNKKKYVTKIVNKKWSMYEYDDEYIWFINNNKIDIEKEYLALFGDKKILSLHIDGHLRKNLSKITKDDYKLSNRIKFVIKK